MGSTINAYITWDEKSRGEVDISLGGSIGLLMRLIAEIIADIEETFPEEERAEFRDDLLTEINAVRKERTNVHT